ncbi:MAG: Hsp20/alpha crystallin family protein, partial [Phycisphaerae bacterium]
MTETTIEKQPECTVSRNGRTRRGRTYRPKVDIVERSDALIVLAELPGVRAEDVNIQFENGMLTIHGAAAARQDEDTNYLMREYGVGDFHRTFQL